MGRGTRELKGRSGELLAKLRHDMAEHKARCREAYAAWVMHLQNPHLLTADAK